MEGREGLTPAADVSEVASVDQARSADRNGAARIWLGAGQAVSVAFAFELVTARVSSVPQRPADASIALFGLILISALPAAAATFVAAPRLRAIAATGAAAVPALWVAGHFEVQTGGGQATAGPALLTACAVGVAGLYHASKRLEPPPATLLSYSMLAGGLLIVYVMGPAPPASMALILLCLSGVCALLAHIPSTLPMALVTSVVIAVWPASPPAPVWSGTRPGAAGPDVLLLTLDALPEASASKMKSFARMEQIGRRFSGLALAPAAEGAGALRGYLGALPGAESGLAEQLAGAGYDTAALVYDPLGALARDHGLARGFDLWDSPMAASPFAMPNATPLGDAARPAFAAAYGGPPAVVGDAHQLIMRATEVLSRRRHRPILLWLHFGDALPPHRSAESADLSEQALDQVRTRTGEQLLVEDATVWQSGAGAELLHAGHARGLDYIDRAILKFMGHYMRRPDRRSTLVMLAGTSGRALPFEPAPAGGAPTGVPLALAYLGGGPGAGERLDSPIDFSDLRATLLGAALGEGAPGGRSLLQAPPSAGALSPGAGRAKPGS